MQPAAQPEPATATAPRDIFSDFGPWDWVFVVLLYMLVVYSILQISLWVFRPGDFRFDFMPMINGTVVVLVAWDAVRLKQRMRNILAGLDQAGVVRFDAPRDREQVLDAMLRLSRQLGLAAAFVVSAGMLGGFVYFFDIITGATIDWTTRSILGPGWRQSIYEMALLLTISGAGAITVGWFLGNMIANGRMLEVLGRFGHQLSGFASEKGVETLRLIEAIFACAARLTLALCALLGSWWIVFRLQLPQVRTYSDWEVPYLIMWGLAFAAFLLAVLIPGLAFNRRLDEIYGGRDARRLTREQLAVARSDLATLDRDMRAAADAAARQRLEHRRDDLGHFVKGLEGRSFQALFLRPSVLAACVVLNLAALLVPLAF